MFFCLLKTQDYLFEVALDTTDKLKILSEIAWYMFERDYKYFMFERIPDYIKENFKTNFEVIVENDLRAQTVIKLLENEDNKYTFLTDGIYSFLISNFLFSKVTNQDDSELSSGLECLGRYELKDKAIGERVLCFLREEINHSNFSDKLKFIIKDKLKREKPYSVWTRYLLQNAKELGIDAKDSRSIDSWSTKQVDFGDENLVLIIPDDIQEKPSEPFLISTHEVTNKMYEEFLNEKPEPISLAELKDYRKKILSEFPGFYWKRGGKWWRIDEKITEREKQYLLNPFSNVINDYHLLLWVNGDPPENRKDHPVVYISWFAAAYYCNWLSKKYSLNPFYDFSEFLYGIPNVRKRKESPGYRLPRASEWRYVAREANSSLKYPWDKFKNGEGLSERGRKVRAMLLKEQPETYPVRSDRPNLFGVTGLIGNVREWVDRGYQEELDAKKDDGWIKGATWLLGESGFNYDSINKVLAANTNLDVGFRFARSLSETEKEMISDVLKRPCY